MERKSIVPGEIVARSPIELREHEAHARLIPSSANSLDELRKSVKSEGRVRVPLVALPDGRVLCGRDRLKVALELGLPSVPVEIRADLADDPDGQVLLIVDDNLSRKHFTEPERVKLAALKLEIEKKLAKARQVEGGRRGGKAPRRKREASGNISGSLPGECRDRVASKIGVSGRHLEKALEVVKAAERGTAPAAKLYLDGTLSASGAHDAMKRLSRREQARLVARVRHAPESERSRVARRSLRERSEPATFSAVEAILERLAALGAACLRTDPGLAKALAQASDEQRARLRRTLDGVGKILDAIEVRLLEE